MLVPVGTMHLMLATLSTLKAQALCCQAKAVEKLDYKSDTQYTKYWQADTLAHLGVNIFPCKIHWNNFAKALSILSNVPSK